AGSHRGEAACRARSGSGPGAPAGRRAACSWASVVRSRRTSVNFRLVGPGGRAMLGAMPLERTHSVETADGSMSILEIATDAKQPGGVIGIQEACGVTDYIADVTRRFAAAGYWAVAPTMFHRAGGGTAPYDDFSKVMPLFKGVSDD